MSSSSLAAPLDIELQAGKPPTLTVGSSGDSPAWAAEHRDAVRAAVAEHGSLLVRGLDLADTDEVGAVFRQLGALMPEKEAFAARQSYSDGATWPPCSAT